MCAYSILIPTKNDKNSKQNPFTFGHYLRREFVILKSYPKLTHQSPKKHAKHKVSSFTDRSSAWCFCVVDAGQWFDSLECYFAIAPRRSQRNWKWSWNAQSCLRTMMRLRRGVWIRLELAWLLWFHTSKNVLKRQISSTDHDAVASRFRACPEKARNIGLSSYNLSKNVVMKQAFETRKSHLTMMKRLRRGMWPWPKEARNIGLTLY